MRTEGTDGRWGPPTFGRGICSLVPVADTLFQLQRQRTTPYHLWVCVPLPSGSGSSYYVPGTSTGHRAAANGVKSVPRVAAVLEGEGTPAQSCRVAQLQGEASSRRDHSRERVGGRRATKEGNSEQRPRRCENGWVLGQGEASAQRTASAKGGSGDVIAEQKGHVVGAQ